MSRFPRPKALIAWSSGKDRPGRCGENGEFDSFVSAGPMLSREIPVRVGETVEREGFAYADLIPSS